SRRCKAPDVFFLISSLFSLVFAFGRCERGTSYGNLSITRFMESAVIWNVDAVEAGPGAEPGFNRFPYYYVGRNEAMSLSGTVNRPRRREGGVTASIASIFSIGSARR